jgi:hypothetical protein
MAQQRRRIRDVLRAERDADAGAHVGQQPVQLERLVEHRENVLGGSHRVGRAGGSRDEHHELVSAQARDDSRVAQRALQPAGELTQDIVTDVMSERVVDLLEAIDVDEQQSDGLTPGARDPQSRLELLEEVPTIAQAGELIGPCLIAGKRELGLRGPLQAPAERDEHPQQQNVEDGADRHHHRRSGENRVLRALQPVDLLQLRERVIGPGGVDQRLELVLSGIGAPIVDLLDASLIAAVRGIEDLAHRRRVLGVQGQRLARELTILRAARSREPSQRAVELVRGRRERDAQG